MSNQPETANEQPAEVMEVRWPIGGQMRRVAVRGGYAHGWCIHGPSLDMYCEQCADDEKGATMNDQPETLRECPFKVGDRVRHTEEVRGNWPEATVTEITEQGFRYEYDEPYVLGTRLGSSSGGEAYESSFDYWEVVPLDSRPHLEPPADAQEEARRIVERIETEALTVCRQDNSGVFHLSEDVIAALARALTARSLAQVVGEPSEMRRVLELAQKALLIISQDALGRDPDEC